MLTVTLTAREIRQLHRELPSSVSFVNGSQVTRTGRNDFGKRGLVFDLSAYPEAAKLVRDHVARMVARNYLLRGHTDR